jgi:PDZ domain-containing protein
VQRRGFTVLLGAVVVALLSLGVVATPVPYVVLKPGPTWDTLGETDGEPVIRVDGAEATDSAGQLRLTTVSVEPEVGLLEAIYAWFNPEQAVVPEELIYPPEQSRQEVEEQNQEQFSRSQTDAEAAALRYLGYPTRVQVVTVVDGAPADGRLRPGDVITSVNGSEVTEVDQLQELVSANPAGTTLTVGYERAGQPGEVEVTTATADGDAPRLGVEVTHEVEAPFELEIQLGDIGGPSAGLMFALGIIDTLEPEDLTGGTVIAGTGSIDALGNVGPIGGIPQKLVAARDAGATVFLVPADNCAEASANAVSGLTMVRVGTLEEAVAGLADLRQGRQPASC